MTVVLEHKCPQDHPCPCVRICPVDAISQKGYGAPKIDKDKCIDCGECENFCPYGAITDLNYGPSQEREDRAMNGQDSFVKKF